MPGLWNGDKPEPCRPVVRLSQSILRAHNIDGQREEMLRLWRPPDGPVVVGGSPPGSSPDWKPPKGPPRQSEEPPDDWKPRGESVRWCSQQSVARTTIVIRRTFD